MAIHGTPAGQVTANLSPGRNSAEGAKPSEFVALGIVIADIPQGRLRKVISRLRSQPDLRLVKIADTEAGESRYRIEVALPAKPDAAVSIVVWRNVKEALTAQFAGDAGTFRICET